MLSYWTWYILSALNKVKNVEKRFIKNTFVVYCLGFFLENCGVGPVSRGRALGFRHIAKGSDAKILDVSTTYTLDLFDIISRLFSKIEKNLFSFLIIFWIVSVDGQSWTI